MIFKTHSHLQGQHARISASKYHWINYDLEKMERVFAASIAAARGTMLHALAHDLIRAKQTLKDTNQTLDMYVNDCIGFRMVPEQTLYYSDNAFGTPDAISFRDNKLRIFDLKTGVTPAHIQQLVVYAAFFCLEYKVNPFEIEIELRIYQNDDIEIYVGDADEIFHVMDKIKAFDRLVDEMRMEEL